MKKIIVSLIMVFCLCSCCLIPVGYVPSKEVNIKELSVDEKKEITYSVSFYDGTSDEFGEQENKFITDIKEHLKNSQLFKKIKQTNELSNELHYHFDIHITQENADAQSFISGLTLGIIPVWIGIHFDINMSVFKNKKEIYTKYLYEQIKYVIWLPFIISAPIWNQSVATYFMRDKILNYYMNEIIENKLY
ncbi:MAG: hypothetical protein MJ250_05505 [Alphaproteobacteria bacterium]|nr:hypothetical protein [Alphaproteobacteria bacterium]